MKKCMDEFWLGGMYEYKEYEDLEKEIFNIFSVSN